MFKVEIRKDCKVCGIDIISKRFRSYCSAECRNRFFNHKYKKQQAAWQRERMERLASIPSDEKVQCLICNRWYTQLLSHVWQIHGTSGREYKNEYGFDVKKGLIKEPYRKVKRETQDPITLKNLKKGAKYRFIKKDTRAGRYKRSKQTLERLKKLHTSSRIQGS